MKVRKKKNCLVAYIDILGFSEASKKKDQNDLLCEVINHIEIAKKDLRKAIKTDAKFIDGDESFEAELGAKIEVFSISDSIFITANPTSRKHQKFKISYDFCAYSNLQTIISEIVYLCFAKGFLIRGCIGYTRELTIIGNSLISEIIPELVEMEKGFSHPRVILHHSLINYLSNNSDAIYKTYCTGRLPFRTHFILDSDGLYFLNWIEISLLNKGNLESSSTILDPLEKIIDHNLSKLYSEKAFKKFSKWFWTKTYFDRFRKEIEPSYAIPTKLKIR